MADNNTKFQTPKGTRDFLPEEMSFRQDIMDQIRSVFEKYGFKPMETPAFEYAETFEGRVGEDEKLIYDFKDKAGRGLALRYDLTVPLARVVALNPQLPKPFKRYCISRVWRYDQPEKGRYREFWQCDIDTVGSGSLLADAEVIACLNEALKRIGLDNYTFRINNRKLLNSLIEYAGVPQEKVIYVFRAIDKIDKISEEKVTDEIVEAGLKKEVAEKVMRIIKIKGKPEYILEKVDEMLGKNEGTDELRELLSFLKELQVKNFEIDLALVRGLDYYTGPIFEIKGEKGIGSIGGGGRWDRMIGKFSGNDTPVTGGSIGLERVIELLKERNGIQKKSTVEYFVAPVNEKLLPQSIQIVQKLRKEGKSTEIDLMARKLGKQFEYADSIGVKKMVIVGEKDLKEGVVTVRNMETGKEEKIDLNKI